MKKPTSGIDQEQDFQILLSRDDYEQMKSYQSKYEKIQKCFNEKVSQWQGERKSLLERINELQKERRQIQMECKGLRVTVDGEYKQFMEMISQLRAACGLSMIKSQSSMQQQIQQLAAMIDNNNNPNTKNSIPLTFHILQKTLTHMTSTLSTIISPIQSLISGNKLTQQAMNNQYIRSQNRIQKLSCQLKQLQTQKLMLVKQHEIQIKQLQDTLRKQHSIITTNLQSQILQLRQHNMQLLTKLSKQQNSRIRVQKQGDLLSQQNHQLHQQIKQLQQENKQYQQHIKILKQSIQIQSRSKMGNNRHGGKSTSLSGNGKNNNKDNNKNTPLSPTSPQKKFQKQSYIKQTLIQYSREIKNNLISIGNLSQDEIKQIGVSQLKTLIKFIHQLEEDFE